MTHAKGRSTLQAMVAPTGLTVWRLPDSTLEIMWPGPGSGLYIGRATTPGGSVVRIQHPTADGVYDNRTSASRAVTAFVKADD